MSGGLFGYVEAQQILASIPCSHERMMALMHFEQFAQVFDIAADVAARRLVSQPFVSTNGFEAGAVELGSIDLFMTAVSTDERHSYSFMETAQMAEQERMMQEGRQPVRDEPTLEEDQPVRDELTAEEDQPIRDELTAEEDQPVRDELTAEEDQPVYDESVVEEYLSESDDFAAEEYLPTSDGSRPEGSQHESEGQLHEHEDSRPETGATDEAEALAPDETPLTPGLPEADDNHPVRERPDPDFPQIVHPATPSLTPTPSPVPTPTPTPPPTTPAPPALTSTSTNSIFTAFTNQHAWGHYAD